MPLNLRYIHRYVKQIAVSQENGFSSEALTSQDVKLAVNWNAANIKKDMA
jgi:hypothetical protein